MLQIKTTFKTSNIQAIGFATCLFFLSMPYYTWNTTFLNKIFALGVLFISIINIRSITKRDLVIIPLFVFFHFYIAYNFSSNILGYIFTSTGIFILLMDKTRTVLFFKYFKFIFVISLAFSLIVYFLIVFLNIDVPYRLIEPLQKEYMSNVYQYPFLISISKLGIANYSIRFSGMFDEPGVVGTLAVFFLFADNFNYKKWDNLILLFAGILSFSFYFYTCIIVKYLLIATFKIRLLFLSLFFVFVYFTYNNQILSTLLWNRFVIEDGTLAGDNRTTQNFDSNFENFMRSGDVLWGKGIKYTQSISETSSTYKSVITSYGMVLFIVVLLAFSLNAYFHIKNKKHFFFYLFIFLGMMYQRPSFFSLNYFFLLVSCVYVINGSVSDDEKIPKRKKLKLSNPTLSE